MEFENQPEKAADLAGKGVDFVSDEFETSGVPLKAKSSQRLRYEAEISIIKKKLGDLESIREQLGLTQRKICQLLLVDPSAWTRWTRDGEDAPPYVYRMLQWYLALQEKYPALDTGFWLNAVSRAREPVETELMNRKIEDIGQMLSTLVEEVGELRVKTDQAIREVSNSSHQELDSAKSQLTTEVLRDLRQQIELAEKRSQRQLLLTFAAAAIGGLLAGGLFSIFI